MATGSTRRMPSSQPAACRPTALQSCLGYWRAANQITDAQRLASRLLDRDQPGPERLAELRAVLRDMIREYRAGPPAGDLPRGPGHGRWLHALRQT
jgi:hypothetical protein